MDMTNLPPQDVPQEPTEQEIAEIDAVLPDEPDLDVEENPDGSATVNLGGDLEDPDVVDFGSNLAEGYLPEGVLSRIGLDLCELIDSDKESRKERDKQQAEGIRRTGLGFDAPGGAEFDGASKAVHPMLAKGCVDFASKAIKELYPASGPCKTQIIGQSTDEKLDKAERKKTYINWQLTTQVPENRAEFEALLSQLPLGGSQYKRWWWDGALKRNRTEAVYVDDVFIPYNQTDFYTSHRVTHRQYISEQEFTSRVTSGLYRDVAGVGTPVSMQERSESRQATDKIEGSEEDSSAYNEEGMREIYMSYVDLSIEEDSESDENRTAPYIVHCEAHTDKVLAVYRNWKAEDDTFAKKHWMVEYKFIPWRGAQGIGLTHLIGSLSAAATGALRALLDAAHISNFPGGLKLKAGRTSGESVQVNATELAEISAPPGVDDIRKLVMAFPFNGPSPVLNTLLEWLTNQAEGVVATASDKIADAGANMPMGTALALIEQGSVNFSAIHSRLHASLKRELEIVHRLNSEHLTDREVVEELGELVVSRADFQGPMDIIPVSDPNIFSEAQRYAQLQAVLQLKADPAFAQFFPPDKLLRRALKLLNIPSVEDIANLPKEPSRRDAIDENYNSACAEPAPLKVYSDQDDLSHLESHVHFMTAPMFGANMLIAPSALPVLLNHCKDHLMGFYSKHAKAAASAMHSVAKAQGLPMDEHQAGVKGGAFADQLMATLLGPTVMPGLAAAMAQMKTLAPPPPATPDAMLANKTQMDIAVLVDKGRTDTKTQDLAYQERRDAADREANAQAAGMATAIEKFQIATQERLAHFTGLLESTQQENAQQAKIAQMELQNNQDKGIAVLQEVLSQMTIQLQSSLAAQPAASPTVTLPDKFGFDLGEQLGPMLQNLAEGSSSASKDIKELKDQMAQDRLESKGVIAGMAEGMQKHGQSLAHQSGMLSQLGRGVAAMSNRPSKVKFDTDATGNITGGTLG